MSLTVHDCSINVLNRKYRLWVLEDLQQLYTGGQFGGGTLNVEYDKQQLYTGGQFGGGTQNVEYDKKITELPQISDTHFHLKLHQVHLALSRNQIHNPLMLLRGDRH